MFIKFKDVDEWSTKDFFAYIKLQCKNNGIEMSADTKQSYMILGRTFKLLKINNRSKSWLKKNIDAFLNSEHTTEVRSLLFINYLTRMLPKKLNDNTIKNLPKTTSISEDTKRKLVMLRRCLNEKN